ncbi:MAG: hypothetical protein NW241_02835 [Bacteroidia bacterium]|nr:hypothetical protein [Bacteroidia bacterium]
MDHIQRMARINRLCETLELDFEVLLSRKRKLLLGGSFDLMYYVQFFVLFTGVQPGGPFHGAEPGAFTFRFLRLEDAGPAPAGLRQTRLNFHPFPETEPLIHKGLYFFAPAAPRFTRMGMGHPPVPGREPLDLTAVIDACLALEDQLPPY